MRSKPSRRAGWPRSTLIHSRTGIASATARPPRPAPLAGLPAAGVATRSRHDCHASAKTRAHRRASAVSRTAAGVGSDPAHAELPSSAASASSPTVVDEHLGAVRVVAEHVEARARRAEQHRVAGLRARERGAHRGLERRAALERNAGRLDDALDRRRVAADRDDRARVARQRRGERREVLALAVAAEDDDQPGRRALAAQADERRDGRADVGALAVVEGVDAVDRGDVLDAMRLAAVLAQRVQHRRERAADRARERQRGERVDGVVAAADAQRVGRHQVLDDDLAARRLRRLVALAREPATPCRSRPPGRSRRRASAAPLPKLTTWRATTLATRPFFAGKVFGAGTSRITAASSRLTTIVARVPKTRALAAA